MTQSILPAAPVPPAIGPSVRQQKVERLLRSLRLATTIGSALAIAVGLNSLLSGVTNLASGNGLAAYSISGGVIIIAGTVVGYLWSMASIEAIALLVDIEANTRRSGASATIR